MHKIAALDDSLMMKNGLYVYTHALAMPEELPSIKVFYQKNKTLEDDLIDFLKETIPHECTIYVCGHYRQFPKLWNIFDFEYIRNKDTPRPAERQFTIAHHAAKESAKKELNKRLIEYSN